MREQLTVWPMTFTANAIRVHNNNHAHTLVPSCNVCNRVGTVWVREGIPSDPLA